MPLYKHFQKVKNDAPRLPKRDKVGACLTCKFWQVDDPRRVSRVDQLALCVQTGLKRYALVVSGASACNAWKEMLPIAPKAKAYAKRFEKND